MGSLVDISASFSAKLEDLKREIRFKDLRLKVASKRIVLRDIVLASEKLMIALQKQKAEYDENHNRQTTVASQLFLLLNLEEDRSYFQQYALIEFQYDAVLSTFNAFGRRVAIAAQKRDDEWLFIEPLLEEENSEFGGIIMMQDVEEAIERLEEGITKATEVKTMLETVAEEWSTDGIKQNIEMDFNNCIQQLERLNEEVQEGVLAGIIVKQSLPMIIRSLRQAPQEKIQTDDVDDDV
ncbi:unnamed protein product [Orchesella dallaii]|uniref:Translin-associated protein X n=1 Tax=Orchesella dallaii TaxID=48710 RepID=A0ABP1QM11_9HEXA